MFAPCELQMLNRWLRIAATARTTHCGARPALPGSHRASPPGTSWPRRRGRRRCDLRRRSRGARTGPRPVQTQAARWPAGATESLPVPINDALGFGICSGLAFT
jgi:hypothetical protein